MQHGRKRGKIERHGRILPVSALTSVSLEVPWQVHAIALLWPPPGTLRTRDDWSWPARKANRIYIQSCSLNLDLILKGGILEWAAWIWRFKVSHLWKSMLFGTLSKILDISRCIRREIWNNQPISAAQAVLPRAYRRLSFWHMPLTPFLRKRRVRATCLSLYDARLLQISMIWVHFPHAETRWPARCLTNLIPVSFALLTGPCSQSVACIWRAESVRALWEIPSTPLFRFQEAVGRT